MKVNGFQDRRDRPLCHLSSVPPNGAKAFVPKSFAKVIKVVERYINFPRITYIHCSQNVYTYRTTPMYLLLKRYIGIAPALWCHDAAMRPRWRDPFTRRMKLVLSKGAGSCGATVRKCGSVALQVCRGNAVKPRCTAARREGATHAQKGVGAIYGRRGQ